jgi:uncharacterized protein YqhQ
MRSHGGSPDDDVPAARQQSLGSAEHDHEPEPLRLGGMALRNGLLVHGPTSWAAAIRTRDGRIEVASGRKPRAPQGIDRVPGARGIVRLGEAMLVIPLVRRALPGARLPFEDARVIGASALAAVGGMAARRRLGAGNAEVAAAALSLLPSLVALRGSDTAQYHGVEHKSIAAYEQGAQDAGEAAKEHDRCGSHLVAPMLAANLAGTALLRRVLAKPSPVAGGVVSLASVGAAVEVFAWSERNAQTRLARMLRMPGTELQRHLGTREPTAAQLEVGRAALSEILRAEGAPAA